MTTNAFARRARPLLAAALLALGACSFLPESEPVRVLDPRPAIELEAAAPLDWTLEIERPGADPMRDSRQVLVRGEDGTLRVLGQLRWVDNGPDLVRELLIRSLADAGRLTDVHASGVRSDRRLELQLRRFELESGAGGELHALVELDVRLLDGRSGQRIAQHVLRSRQSVAGVEAHRVVAGFEAVLGALAAELADWLAEAPPPGATEAAVR